MVTAGLDEADVRRLLDAVHDPEIPVLSLADLGVLRGVEIDGRCVTVTLTPTYSGCPALEEMRADVETCLRAADLEPVVRIVLAPAWTTSEITAAGRQALRDYGIAPPTVAPDQPVPLTLARRVLDCPQCGSTDTEQLSRFGSTACQEMWRCRSCREPFDHLRDL